MNEQMEMFGDPLEERAKAILKRAFEQGLEDEFDSHHGGSLVGISYYFNPRDHCFYYSNRIFNSYKPEPWVRKKTASQIREMFI